MQSVGMDKRIPIEIHWSLEKQGMSYFLELWYQSKTIRYYKNVSYDTQLSPIIAKGQRAPNAQIMTHQIVDM